MRRRPPVGLVPAAGPVEEQGLTVLGVPVGSASFVRSQLRQSRAGHDRLLGQWWSHRQGRPRATRWAAFERALLPRRLRHATHIRLAPNKTCAQRGGTGSPRDTEKPLQHRLAAHGVKRTDPINGDKSAFRIKLEGGRQQTNNTLRTRSRGQSKLKGRAGFLESLRFLMGKAPRNQTAGEVADHDAGLGRLVFEE